MNYTKNVISLLFLSFVFSCFNGCKSSGSEVDKKIKRKVDEWRSDSLGCLKLRNKDKAEWLIKNLDLENKGIDDIIIHLGKPNSVYEDSTTKKIKYYFDTLCRDSTLVDSSDYCWVEFVADKSENNSVSTDILCY